MRSGSPPNARSAAARPGRRTESLPDSPPARQPGRQSGRAARAFGRRPRVEAGLGLGGMISGQTRARAAARPCTVRVQGADQFLAAPGAAFLRNIGGIAHRAALRRGFGSRAGSCPGPCACDAAMTPGLPADAKARRGWLPRKTWPPARPWAFPRACPPGLQAAYAVPTARPWWGRVLKRGSVGPRRMPQRRPHGTRAELVPGLALGHLRQFQAGRRLLPPHALSGGHGFHPAHCAGVQDLLRPQNQPEPSAGITQGFCPAVRVRAVVGGGLPIDNAGLRNRAVINGRHGLPAGCVMGGLSGLGR